MIKGLKIISGGQSGVDRAALDFALKNHIACAGWCPKGRLAEDGLIPLKYPLKETSSPEYSSRTKANVLDSDATLILHMDKMGNGTRLTYNIAKCEKKTFYLVQLNQIEPGILNDLYNWLKENKIKTLNIAGPRGSESPGIYKITMDFLEKIFTFPEA